MKKRQIRTLYNRALSLALAVSTTASLCLGVSGVTAAMEEQRQTEEAVKEEVAGEVHHHTFACYEEYELNCKENHGEDEHRMECYQYSGELVCGLEEGDLHLHGLECEAVAKVLICEEGTMEEGMQDAQGAQDAEGDETFEQKDDQGESLGEDATEPENQGEESVGTEDTGKETVNSESEEENSTGTEKTGEETADSESGREETTGTENGGEEAADAESGEGESGEEESRRDVNAEAGNSGEGSAEEESTQEGNTEERNTEEENTEAENTQEEDSNREFEEGKSDNESGKENAPDGGTGNTNAEQGVEQPESKDDMSQNTEAANPDIESTKGNEEQAAGNDEGGADHGGNGAGNNGNAIENSENQTGTKESSSNTNSEGSIGGDIDKNADNVDTSKGSDQGNWGEGRVDVSGDNIEESGDKRGTAGENSAPVSGAQSSNDEGTVGSKEGSAGEEEASGEKNIGTAKSGRDRFSLLAVNNRPHSSIFFPQLYIGSPLNALMDNILADENSIANKDAATDGQDDESETGKEESEEEVKKTVDTDNGEAHQHSEECYKIVYKCREGAKVMALREGGIEVADADALGRTIENNSQATIIITQNIDITETYIIGSGKNITIDLQGHKITYKGTTTNTSMFEVNGGTLTIEDSANAQQNARKISEEIVDKAGEAVYDEDTGKLTYYVTECKVNLDGKGTTNIIRKYEYDLGINKDSMDFMGALVGTNLTSIISVDSGTVTLQGGCLTGCNGSGISVTSGTITISGGYIEGCGQAYATAGGGAVYIKGGGLTVSGGVLLNNQANQGGAIRVENSATVTISGGIIANNSASLNGGGIRIISGTLNISGNAIFAANTAEKSGGAVALSGLSSLINCKGGYIVGNTAKGNAEDKNENDAQGNGGGIYFLSASNSGNLIENVVISGNTAVGNGGGIYLTGSKTSLGSGNNTTMITANTAGENGGGVCINDNFEQNPIFGGKVIIAANSSHSTNLVDNNLYPIKQIQTIPSTCYIEQEGVDGEEVNVDTYEALENAIEDNKNKNKVIKLNQEIILEKPVIINEGKDITILLNGNDIKPKEGFEGSSLFIVGEKSEEDKSEQKSYLTIKNKGESDNRSVTEILINESASEITSDNVGRAGSYDGDMITYYLTKSVPVGNESTNVKISTQETTYKYSINLHCNDDDESRIGAIQGNNFDSVISAGTQGTVIIKDGIITGAKHGVKLENGAVMSMYGGYIVGCGNKVNNIEDIIAEDDGKSLENGAGIYADEATGIQIFDGVIAGNTTPKRGGGIFANKSIVEVSGGIIAGNTAGNVGGGICVQGCEKVTIGNDLKSETSDLPLLVISGNTAIAGEPPAEEKTYKSRRYGGGGIFADSYTLLSILHNAYITNNRAEGNPVLVGNGIYDGAGLGGGGVFSCGKIVMSGSYVTANYSKASGGGVFSYAGQRDVNTGRYLGEIILTDGVIAGNYAVYDEGGGLRIDHKGEIESREGNKIYITNNKTDTTTNWGGGGIFNTSGATTTIENVLITNNTAEGFGGGIAGCNHGTNQFFVNHGAGVFDNRAEGTSEKLKGDTFPNFSKNERKNYADCIDVRTPVIQNGEAENGKHIPFINFKNGSDDEPPSYQDFYCSNISQVYGKMLGGGEANWRGSGSNSSKYDKSPTAVPIKIEADDYAETSNLMGLTAHPSDTDKKNAIADAKIYITGNKSAAHGAGVMTNGTFKIGTDEGNLEAGTLTIEKELQDINGKEISPDNQQKFKFLVSLMNTEGAALTGTYPYRKEPHDASDEDVDKNGVSIHDISITTKKVKSEEGNPEGAEQEEIVPAEVYLRAGQKLIISRLPDGAYGIVEEENTDSPYEILNGKNEKQGVLWSDDGRSVKFINVPKPLLRIKKLLQDNSEENADKHLFAFTIQLKGSKGENITGECTYIKDPFSQEMDGKEAKERGEITFTEGESEKIYLRNGQMISLYGSILEGATYHVIESQDGKYEPEDGEYEKSGVIKNQSTETVTFINVLKTDNPDDPKPEDKRGSLILKKEIQDSEGNPVNSDHSFTFAIQMKGADGQDLVGKYPSVKASVSSVEGEIEEKEIAFESGKSTEVTLQGGQSFSISNLPEEAKYEITEIQDDSGYIPNDGNYVKDGSISSSTEETVIFINVPKPKNPSEPTGSLTIKKELQDTKGTLIHVLHPFTFILKLTDADGKEISGKYSYTKTPLDSATDRDNTDGELEFKEDERVTVSLYSGQSITIRDLPKGICLVKENEDSKYKAKDGNYEQEAEILEDKETSITFVNVSQPDESETPSSSEEESTPEASTDPENPDNPDKPEPSSSSEEESTPEASTDPENPDNPENPENPEPSSSSEEESTPEAPTDPEKPDNPDNPESPSSSGEESTPEAPTDPQKPDNPESPTDPQKPDRPETPGNTEDLSTPETTTDPENPNQPDNPPPSTTAPSPGGGGGGGRRHDNPTTSPQPTTAPPTETVPVNGTEPGTETLPALETPSEPGAGNPGLENPGDGNPGAGNPGVNVPQYLTELPDPNVPGSPDLVTIMEDDVPRTYIKVWDPEKEEYVYLPEDEVPLSSMLPKTGDPFKKDLWRMMFILSLISTAVLLCLKVMESRRQREE